MTKSEEYWIGKGINLDQLWEAFDGGPGYQQKVAQTPLHLLRLTFDGHPLHLPLFDFEVIFKTVKGTFHEVKFECLTPEAYDAAAPIFLHRVDRGSGIFEFLAQFDPLMTWVVALGAASMWYRGALASDQAFDNERLTFIRTHFPNAGHEDVQAYMKAWTTFGRRRVLQRMLAQGLAQVEVSDAPLSQNKEPILVDLEPIVRVRDDDAAV